MATCALVLDGQLRFKLLTCGYIIMLNDVRLDKNDYLKYSKKGCRCEVERSSIR